MRDIASYEGMKGGGKNLNNIRYTDDTILFAEKEKELQDMFNKVKHASERNELNTKCS